MNRFLIGQRPAILFTPSPSLLWATASPMGTGLEESQAYPALLESRLQKEGYSCTVINAGISGETSSGLLSRIDRVVLLKPDIIILCTGANDGLGGIDHRLIQHNISRMVQTFKERQVTVVLAGRKYWSIIIRHIPSRMPGCMPKSPNRNRSSLCHSFWKVLPESRNSTWQTESTPMPKVTRSSQPLFILL